MSINKAFVVKNGLEVSTDLILADADTNKVGIGITAPQYTLHVNGGIGATNFYVSGISTFNNIFLNGYLSVGNTTGQQNQILVSTGIGVTWKTSSNLRTSTSFTATLGQTTFSATYSIGYVDVYINGVKLTNTEFVATNGTSIVLNDACFGGEAVEIISFEVEYPLTFSGITLQEEGSVVGTGIGAINFVGAAVTAVSVGAGSTIFVNAQLPLTSSSNVVVGIITATGRFNGNLTGNINSSGVSTVTSLNATNINASGIVTATSGFVGALTGTASTATLATSAQGLTGTPNITVGIVTSIGGFVSIAGTTPVTIQLVGNQLTFNAVGIGSTTLTLF